MKRLILLACLVQACATTPPDPQPQHEPPAVEQGEKGPGIDDLFDVFEGLQK